MSLVGCLKNDSHFFICNIDAGYKEQGKSRSGRAESGWSFLRNSKGSIEDI